MDYCDCCARMPMDLEVHGDDIVESHPPHPDDAPDNEPNHEPAAYLADIPH